MPPLLSIQNLNISFHQEGKRVPVLHDISFSVNHGETVAIVGESGSGKSVSALAILRLLPAVSAAYSGSIYFSPPGEAPRNILHLTEKEMQSIRGNQISIIFQEPMTSLNPLYSCGDQVMEAILQHQKISLKAARQKTIELFEQVQLPNPAGIFNRFPHEISGGQKQRVMISMAISGTPSLLIADEPTTALDVTVQQNILRLIRSLKNEKKISVIFISHDLGLVSEIADRVLVMYKGKIVEQNKTDQLFSNPQHPYTSALLACRPILHKKGERLPVVSDFLNTENENNRGGFEIRDAAEKTNMTRTNQVFLRDSSVPIISVDKLRMWFPGDRNKLTKTNDLIKAVNDVSFDIRENESVGLVGESGCGKTTLGRCILRLLEPTSGKVLFRGENILAFTQSGLKRMRKDLQIIFQDPYSSLNPRMPIGSAIMEGMKVHGIGKNSTGRKDMIINLLEKVNLNASHYPRYPHQFSGGQRQRIGIARALALNPSFIVCDESVSALDVSVQAQVLNLLNDLKKEFGFATLFISHDLSVVRYFSDRIVVMFKGEIEETGTSEEIYNQPKSQYTKALIAAIPKGIFTTEGKV